jgi:hypothetical protein
MLKPRKKLPLWRKVLLAVVIVFGGAYILLFSLIMLIAVMAF